MTAPDIEMEPVVDSDNNSSDAEYMSDDVDNGVPSDEGSVDENTEELKSGWADAMAKVLTKSGSNHTLLSKAKKDSQGVSKVTERKKVAAKKKAELDAICRSKPNVGKDRMKEKKLTKLATKGVVQLFNAVREQQKTLKSQLNQAGGSIRRQEKVYKNINKDEFLNVLSGSKGKKPVSGEADEEIKEEIKTEVKEEGTWNILKDDFMLGAKMRDWDKESDDE